MTSQLNASSFVPRWGPKETAYRFEPGKPCRGSATLLRPSCDQRHPYWCRNINLLSITYAFRPRLRGRLTLRRLALRRKPWTFGENVSHILYRYLCQHSHFRYLQHPLQDAFTGLRNAPLPLICLHMNPHLRYMTLAPLHCRRRKT